MRRLLGAVALAAIVFAASVQPVVAPRAEPARPIFTVRSFFTPSVKIRPEVKKAEPTPKPTAKPKPTPKPRTLRGIASWGDFGGHVVTRLPRGTRITVTGPLGSWSGRSWGYGPAKRTKRIVDLDRSVFADLCGDPAKGLCTVTLSWQRD